VFWSESSLMNIMVPQQNDSSRSSSPTSSGIPMFGSQLINKNSSTPYTDATQVSCNRLDIPQNELWCDNRSDLFKPKNKKGIMWVLEFCVSTCMCCYNWIFYAVFRSWAEKIVILLWGCKGNIRVIARNVDRCERNDFIAICVLTWGDAMNFGVWRNYLSGYLVKTFSVGCYIVK
jgi:hypothetical protein